MKITVKQLRELINEERALSEADLGDDIMDDVEEMALDIIRFVEADGSGTLRDIATTRAALEMVAALVQEALMDIERERRGL
jgi:hypothetical protein